MMRSKGGWQISHASQGCAICAHIAARGQVFSVFIPVECEGHCERIGDLVVQVMHVDDGAMVPAFGETRVP